MRWSMDYGSSGSVWYWWVHTESQHYPRPEDKSIFLIIYEAAQFEGHTSSRIGWIVPCVNCAICTAQYRRAVMPRFSAFDWIAAHDSGPPTWEWQVRWCGSCTAAPRGGRATATPPTCQNEFVGSLVTFRCFGYSGELAPARTGWMDARPDCVDLFSS